ncbi:hypothetical protein ACRAOD_17445 [Raoultella ornithinolytica]|uniref:hypothetical protein n=1 Tax=Raoultella ornithinolytica TaxID=54291 RepID=UPI0021BB2A2B|nr:hypothetical protein [Raoultella ornithinolytica]MCT8173056.1 hypothetical protein [Raoultella ornithinolytica]
MKKLLMATIITLTTACTSHHSWMDKAYIGYVDQQAVVMFDAGIRNGVRYYRPQFQSDCHYNKAYFDEQSSTGCVINETRIADIHPYNKHAEPLGKGGSTQLVRGIFSGWEI